MVIQKIINKALSLISAGKFDELKKKYKYDELYHLSLMCNVGGKLIYVEKNEVINIVPNFTITTHSEIRDVPLGEQKLTINEMLKNTLNKIGNVNFFQYDAFTTNCQRFILDILESNKLNNKELTDFILQPMANIVKELPSFLPKVARKITDVAGIISRLRGDGYTKNY